MKYILLFCFVPAFCFSQITWQWQNPLPSGNSYFDIQAFPNGTVYAAGQYGTFVKFSAYFTSSIETKPFPVKDNITSISFHNTFDGWAITHANGQYTIYHTTDGADSWNKVTDFQGSNISVSYSGNNSGFVTVDSTLYHIQPGSVTDKSQFHETIHDIQFIDDKTGWIIGKGKVFRTTDAGLTWQPYVINVNPADVINLNKIDFIDSKTGWAAANYRGAFNDFGFKIFKTTDGGVSWTEQLSTSYYYVSFGDMKFINADTGWAISSLKIYKTTNGGVDWSDTQSPQNLNYIAPVNSSLITAGGARGSLFISTDGGLNWQNENRGFSASYNGLFALDQNIIFAAADSQFVKSSDGGINWQSSNLKYLAKDYILLRSVYFTGHLNGVISSDNTQGYGSIYRTSDGGQTWKTVLDSILRVFDISFLDKNTGFTFSGSDLFISTDGGKTWNKKGLQGFLSDVLAVRFVSESRGFAGGYLGFIQTSDGGKSWSKVNIDPPSPYVQDISAPDEKHIFVAGYYDYSKAYFIRTTDGGMNWKTTPLPLPDLQVQSVSLAFIDSLHGFYTGYDFAQTEDSYYGFVFFTKDGGDTWQKLDFPPGQAYQKIRTFDKTDAWLISNNGGIIHIDIHGISGVKSAGNLIPEDYELFQNYPNPFNPSTKIKFSIPKESFVSLEVFDVLGNKAAELINETLKPGQYEIPFTPRGLSSGIYLYRLKSGFFTRTMKLLILK